TASAGRDLTVWPGAGVERSSAACAAAGPAGASSTASTPTSTAPARRSDRRLGPRRLSAGPARRSSLMPAIMASARCKRRIALVGSHGGQSFPERSKFQPPGDISHRAELPTGLCLPTEVSGVGGRRWTAVRPWLGLVARLGLAAVWLVAGAVKLGDLAG